MGALNDAFIKPHLLTRSVVAHRYAVGQLQELPDLSEPVITFISGSEAC